MLILAVAWSIKTYETRRGEKSVDEFVKSCDSQTISKITHLIDLLEKHGHLLRMPHSKKLSIEIYELRVRGKQEVRITYAFKGKTVWLLHAFKKQTQKTPVREILTSEKRLFELDAL
ncbi:MAG: type II toxin-antitoxin system RelE/ParE family toxin [bacterium]|nr:type II toxin-antitoxin system RelE/ParE family toxin [bacterium]